MLAVAEAARNVACSGARPLGATNCLNFGNPERPAIMWQFAQAVEGIGEACRALGVPITGGNVSLYNETDGNAVYPTPVIGVVGLLEHADRVVGGRFKASGDVVMLLGEGRGELGGSEYLKLVYDQVRGVPPALDLDRERALQDLLVRLADEPAGSVGRRLFGRRHCGHARGVLFRHLAGLEPRSRLMLSRSRTMRRLDEAAALFGESASRVVVSAAAENVTRMMEQATAAGVPARVIGQTGGNRLRIATGGRMTVDVSIEDAERAWSAAIDSYFAEEDRLMDKFKDECGVFGIFGHPEAANMTYLGLYALQHRGQESAGIAASDGAQIRVSKAMGYVADTFDGETLSQSAGFDGDWPCPLFHSRREQDLQRSADSDRVRDTGRSRFATMATW